MSLRDDNLVATMRSLVKGEQALCLAILQSGNALAIVRLRLATSTDAGECRKLTELRLRLDNELLCLASVKESTRATRQILENEIAPLLGETPKTNR